MPAQLVPAQRGGLKPDGLKKLVDALAVDLPEGGFAWALDESGAIIARNGQANLDPDPERARLIATTFVDEFETFLGDQSAP